MFLIHGHEETKGANPVIAILIAIILAILMVISTTTIFLRSGAYDTVKQIQAGTEAVKLSDVDMSTVGPIKSEDIDNYSTSINNRINSLNDYEAFGPEALSETSLGI